MAKVQKNPRFSYSLIFRRKDVLSVDEAVVANCYKKMLFLPKNHEVCLKNDDNAKKYVKIKHFVAEKFVGNAESAYLCNVFFMVLDLRLTKIGCRETINSFFIPTRMD